MEFFGFFVGDFDGEFFFESHDEFDGVEGVGAEVFDEAGGEDDLLGVDAQLVDDDVTDFIIDGFFRHKGRGWVGGKTGLGVLIRWCRECN